MHENRSNALTLEQFDGARLAAELSVTPFGRSFRKFWRLQRESVFLNHGSFGACPIWVRDWQARIYEKLDRHPDQFFFEEIVPNSSGGLLRQSSDAIAAAIGANPDNVALVENATLAIETILRSSGIKSGEAVLCTNHLYNAIRIQLEQFTRQVGAELIVVEIPDNGTSGDVTEAIDAAATPNTRLAVFDHITSASALALPVDDITRMLQRRGVRVLIDGAHTIGQVDLDLNSLAPDWYVSNAHKWLFAPPGAAVIYAGNDPKKSLLPPVTSHFAHLGFPKSYHYLGTRDYSSWLVLRQALAFSNKLAELRLSEYLQELSRYCDEQMCSLGVAPLNMELSAPAMRAYTLEHVIDATEASAENVMQRLWVEHGIQSRINKIGRRLLLRVSFQAYVDADDIDRLKVGLGSCL